ncbi:MAG: hypothetical protein JWN74_1678 [Acidobacteriaceae bacterium]|nr:hypothetical protein [Acidobacteriaceae bacterium]
MGSLTVLMVSASTSGTNNRCYWCAIERTGACATSTLMAIADHMLQGTTGTELAREMKKIKPDVPIILFSGSLPQNFKGVDVYVNKGEPTMTFLGIVREVVQRSCS